MKKKWVEKEFTLEVMVGTFILLILLGLGYFTIILSRETWFGTKYEQTFMFNDVMGLREGDSVVVRGMPIGKVRELCLCDSGVRVITTLDEPLSLRQGDKVAVVSSSILGGKYLSVSAGPTNSPMLAKDEPVWGENPYDLVEDTSELIASIKDDFVGENGVLENIRKATEQIRTITERLENGKGTLGKLLSEDETLYNDLKETIDEVRTTIDDYRETAPIVTFTSIFFGAF